MPHAAPQAASSIQDPVSRRFSPPRLPASQLPSSTKGYTLIELVVVVALLGLLLAFAIPRFQPEFLLDESRRDILLMQQSLARLKERSLTDQKDFVFNLDLDSRRFWITDDTMDEQSWLEAKEHSKRLSSSLTLQDVETAPENRQVSGQVEIHFRKAGYSDRALIHLLDGDGSKKTIVVESFLAEVELVEDHASF